MENINDFQHTSFKVRSKGLKGFQSRYTTTLSKKNFNCHNRVKNFRNSICIFKKNKKIRILNSPKTFKKSIHVLIMILQKVWIYQTSYRLLQQVQKKFVKSSGTKRVGNIASISYPSCKVILSGLHGKKTQKLVKQQQQETSSERS